MVVLGRHSSRFRHCQVHRRHLHFAKDLHHVTEVRYLHVKRFLEQRMAAGHNTALAAPLSNLAGKARPHHFRHGLMVMHPHPLGGQVIALIQRGHHLFEIVAMHRLEFAGQPGIPGKTGIRGGCPPVQLHQTRFIKIESFELRCRIGYFRQDGFMHQTDPAGHRVGVEQIGIMAGTAEPVRSGLRLRVGITDLQNKRTQLPVTRQPRCAHAAFLNGLHLSLRVIRNTAGDRIQHSGNHLFAIGRRGN